MVQVYRARAPASRSVAGPAAVMVIAMLVAVLVGLSVSVLPVQLSILFSGTIVMGLALLVMAVAPPMTTVPARALAWGLVIVIAFYFIWPRNVFLPLRGLPVKHPQRLLYLMFLAYAFYVLVKCAPARAQLARGLKAVPWLSALWLVFVIWQLISLVLAKHALGLFGGWLVDTLVATLLYPLALLCLNSVRDCYRLFGGLLVAAVVNCLFAIPETLLHRNLFDRFVTLDGMDPEAVKQFLAAKLRGGQFRAQGAFDHPLLLAEFLAVNLPFALVLLLQRGRRLLGAGAVSLLLMGLYLSHSRTALVAGVVAVSAMVLALIIRGARQGRRNPWPLVGALFAIPVAVAGFVFASGLLQRVAAGTTATEASSTEARWAMLRGGWRLIQQEPVFGHGPGTAGYVLNFQNSAGVMTLDNYLLALGLDFGLPGLFLYLAVLAVTAWRALSIAVDATDNNRHFLAWALFGAVLAFAPIKMVLGTGLNNLLLYAWMAVVAALVVSDSTRTKSANLHDPLIL